MGKFTPIASVVVQFSQPDIHWLASGDLELGPLFQTTNRDQLAADSVGLLRHGTQALLEDLPLNQNIPSRLSKPRR